MQGLSRIKKKKKAFYVSVQLFWYKKYVYINSYIEIYIYIYIKTTSDSKECLAYTTYHDKVQEFQGV